MAWVYVIAGGLTDVGWGTFLKLSDSFTSPLPTALTVVCFILSFYLFAKSMSSLPIGVAYSVFIGIGAAGMVMVGMIFLGEPRSFWRIFFICLLIAGILGLKWATGEEAGPEAAKKDG